MPKLNQRGVIHFLLPLILLAGIFVGVYLITSGNPLKLFSKASNPPIVFKDSTGAIITKTNSPTVKIEFSTTLSSSTVTPPTTDGLIGYYKFDEPNLKKGARIIDSSPSKNNGKVVNSVISDSGIVSGAGQFDGATTNNSYIELTSLNEKILATSGTVSVWVYPTAKDVENRYAFHALGSQSNRFYIQYYNSTFAVSRGNPGTSIQLTKPQDLQLNTWYNLTMSWDGTNVNGYLNDKLVASKSYSSQSASNGSNVFIGAQSIGKVFPGKIDEVRVYNKMLSTEQIATIYTSIVPPQQGTPISQPATVSTTELDNVVSTCTACAADINKDGWVNITDASRLSGCYLKGVTGDCVAADINRDSKINAGDYACLTSQFNKKCETTATLVVCSACSADVDKSGYVNTTDFSLIKACQDKSVSEACSNADVNGDKVINPSDINCWQTNLGQKCQESVSPTSTPISTVVQTPTTVTTAFYRYAETPADLDAAAYTSYTATPMVVDYTFKDITPGQKFIWVDFKDSTGKTDRKSAQLEILATTKPQTQVTTQVRDSILGKAIKITSEGSGITIPGSNMLKNQEFTIEGWFKWSGDQTTVPGVYSPQPVPLAQYLLAKQKTQNTSASYVDNSHAIYFRDDSYLGNELIAYASQNAEVLTVANPLIDKKWHHIAHVRKSQPIRSGERYPRLETQLYIDGKLQKDTWTFGNMEIWNGNLLVGWNPYKIKDHALSFLGEIDEVRVSKIARYSKEFYPTATPFTTDSDTEGLWHFDGNVQDSSGNNYHGQSTKDVQFIDSTASPSYTYQSPIYPKPGFGNAISFKGDKGYVMALNPFKADNFENLTIDAWVMLRSKGVLAPILYQKGRSYWLDITPDRKLKFTYTVDLQGRWAPAEITSDSAIEEGKWTHVAVVYNNVKLSQDQGLLSLYINGQRVAQKREAGPIGGGNSGTDILIGNGNDDSSFTGAIDEVRINKSPKYLGDSNFTPGQFGEEESNLLLCHFNENEGTPVCTSGSTTSVKTWASNVDIIKTPL